MITGAFRLIDLSVPLGPGPSEILPVHIERWNHREGGSHLAELAGLMQHELPNGMGWASERLSALTHAGTHVDAPFHYAPVSCGSPSRTIDQIPVDWFWGRGVRLDVHDTSGAAVTADEVREAERVDGMRIEAGDIVLFRTGAGAYYGHHDYNERGRGLDPSVIELLCKRGVRVLGTDAWSIDPPFPVMRADIARRGPAAAWEAHYMGRHLQFCAIERLSQLELLPAHGFWVACFPVKVSGGSAGWTRAVAFVPGGQQ